MVLPSPPATALVLSILLAAASPALAIPEWPDIGRPAEWGSVLAGDFVRPAANPYTLSIHLIPSIPGPLTAGQSLDLSVRFSDLDPSVPEIISGYDLILTFDPLLLEVTGVTFPTASVDALTDAFFLGPDLDNSYDGTGLLPPIGSGEVRFSAFSFAFDDELEVLQAGFENFDAVEIAFRALMIGQSAFGYIYDPARELDIKGPDDSNNPGTAIIYDLVTAAPAPAALPLLLTGLALLRLLAHSGSGNRVIRFRRILGQDGR